MKRGLVLVLGFFLISAGLSFAREAKVSPVAFTLSATNDESSPIPFTLAPRPTEPRGLTSLGGLAVLEDCSWPYNTTLGCGALGSGDPMAGQRNTAIGYSALGASPHLSDNTALGFSALTSIDGDGNTAVGSNSLYNGGTSGNTAVGFSALQNNSFSSWNTALGAYALNNNFYGPANVAVGTRALANNYMSAGNTAIGYEALGHLESANVADQKSCNTALGYQAGSAIQGSTTLSRYNVFIGANQKGVSGDTCTIRLGLPYDTSLNPPAGQNRTFIAGIVETPFTTGDVPAVVGITSEGRLGTMSSDLLPEGPQGPQGIQGPPGPAGESLVPGSLLFLNSGFAPPAGYAFLGTTDISLAVPGVKRGVKLTVNVYQKQ